MAPEWTQISPDGCLPGTKQAWPCPPICNPLLLSFDQERSEFTSSPSAWEKTPLSLTFQVTFREAQLCNGVRLAYRLIRSKAFDCTAFMYTVSLNLHDKPLDSILLLDICRGKMKAQRGQEDFLRKQASGGLWV